MKEKITHGLLNLIKVKSIVTFGFLIITFIAVIKGTILPEWLIPIVTLCFKELFDKDKVKNKEDNNER